MTTQINETISVRIDAADNGTCELWAYSDNGVDIQENFPTVADAINLVHTVFLCRTPPVWVNDGPTSWVTEFPAVALVEG